MKLAKDHRLQIQFDADMMAYLRTAAEKKRCSIAHVVRDLILTEMDKKKR